MSQSNKPYHVAVIGAGPAGLFAARELAQQGINVTLINRDIKPGGLAEYGIYPSKENMKNGLRKQFRKIMDDPQITYYGNLTIGHAGDISLEDLQKMGFDAVLVTVGAQGTKWLGMPGEDLTGVYHAKDLVYHYNKLPPYSEQSFPIGKRVVLIGAGNVMLDIAHYAIRDLKVEEVVAVVRRGPADVKFTKKEFEITSGNLDVQAFEKEFERCIPDMERVNQDLDAAKEFILGPIEKSYPKVSETRFLFDFLAQPTRMVGNGKVEYLEVEETRLELRADGSSKSVSTGVTRQISADTVVFCIGDKTDESFGLPMDKWGDFAKSQSPIYPVGDISYESEVPGVFLAGWAREASTGLVGAARKDGTNGAHAVLAFLETVSPKGDAQSQLQAALQRLGTRIVTRADWQKLDAIELAEAEKHGLESFRFDSNAKMLEVIG